MFAKKGKAITMNKLYIIPCYNGILLLFAPLIDDRASLSKSKRETICITVFAKKGKATSMNKLYIIPCYHGMPLLFAPLIDDRASLPKRKEKHNLNNSVSKERKSNYYE